MFGYQRSEVIEILLTQCGFEPEKFGYFPHTVVLIPSTYLSVAI